MIISGFYLNQMVSILAQMFPIQNILLVNTVAILFSHTLVPFKYSGE